jgi:hypothetical protein
VLDESLLENASNMVCSRLLPPFAQGITAALLLLDGMTMLMIKTARTEAEKHPRIIAWHSYSNNIQPHFNGRKELSA